MWLFGYLFFSSYLILADYIFKGISKAGHFLRINPGGSQSFRNSKICQYKYRWLIDDPSPRYSKLFVCKGHVNIPASNATISIRFGIQGNIAFEWIKNFNLILYRPLNIMLSTYSELFTYLFGSIIYLFKQTLPFILLFTAIFLYYFIQNFIFNRFRKISSFSNIK